MISKVKPYKNNSFGYFRSTLTLILLLYLLLAKNNFKLHWNPH